MRHKTQIKEKSDELLRIAEHKLKVSKVGEEVRKKQLGELAKSLGQIPPAQLDEQ